MSIARRVVLAFLITLVSAGLAAPLLAMLTVRAQTDPWLGAHASLTCSRVCDGCHGPYEIRGGTHVNGSSRRGKPSKMYCQPPRGTLDEASNLDAYEVKDGSLAVIVGALVVVVPVLALLSFAALTLLGRRKRAGQPA